MLGTPPPGFTTSAMNRQTVGPLSLPGQQGLVPQQGYNPTSSGYSLPSSAAYPSSMPRPVGSPGGTLPPGISPQQAAQALMRQPTAVARPHMPGAI